MAVASSKARGPLGLAWRLTFDSRDVVRRLDRLKQNTPLEAARTLNDQRRKSRTLILKEFVPESMVIRGKEGTPRQTLHARILLSRSGTARKFSLLSVALILVEVMSARHFARSSSVIPGQPPRPVIPAQGKIERGSPDYVNLGEVAYPIRNRAVAKLAKEFPAAFLKRMQRQINRIFG